MSTTEDPKLPTTGVRYIGRHESTVDGLYSTGAWRQGEVKLIDNLTADRMLKHTDSYEKVADKKALAEASDMIKRETVTNEKLLDEQAMQEARESVRTLSRDALREYAEVHYGQKLPGNISQEKALEEVNGMIDRFGAQ